MLVKVSFSLFDSTFSRAVALGLAYWLTVILAIELVSPVDKIALFWPPNAIAAAALIFSSRKNWLPYLIVVVLAYFAARVPGGHLPLYVYFSFCAANVIEILIVVEAVKRLVSTPINHENLTKVLTVAMLASVPASIVSALIGGTFVSLAVEKATFMNASVGWFTGDLCGLLLVLPVLLTWSAPGAFSLKSRNKGIIVERTVIASIFAVIALLTPAYLANESQISLIFPYLVFPVLIWTAMRLGIRGATAATLAVGLFAIALTYLGQGPFSFEGLSAFGQVVSMKIGLITITLTTIFLAVVVTERWQTEEALRESEDLINSIIENVPVGLLIKDSEHIVERANSTYLRWYGFDAETLESRRSDEIEDFQSSEEAKFMNAQELEVLTTGLTQARQVERPFADGKIHTVNITKFPIYDQQGNITKVGSVSVDLTDQVQARKALEQSESRFRNVINNSPMFISLKDTDGHYKLSNQGHADLFGLKQQDVVGKSISEVLHKKVAKDATAGDRKVLETKAVVVEEREIITKKGTFDYLVTKFPILDETGAIKEIGTIGVDITELKNAEEERNKALVDAERANQAKSEFLATMSHELRTPLNAILGFSDILSHQYFGPPGEGKYREYAEDIHASGEHLLELVNDILDISTIEAGKQSLNKEMLVVNEMVAESFNAIGQKAQEKAIKLIAEVSKNLPPLYADRRAVRQIFLNLLTNAVKYTPQGGKITVSAKASKQKITFKIADTGQGIPTETLSNLTEPFNRGEQDPHRTVDGWGLGLSISKSLIDLHDGELDITSKVGKGTTVTVTLPNEAP